MNKFSVYTIILMFTLGSLFLGCEKSSNDSSTGNDNSAGYSGSNPGGGGNGNGDGDGGGLIITPPEDTTTTAGNLSVTSGLSYPTRIAEGINGELYIADTLQNSVFIMDDRKNIVGQLKNLNRPSGIAVDEAGSVYVGNTQGGNRIEIFEFDLIDKSAKKTGIINAPVSFPGDMEFDRNGNLFIADLKGDQVVVLSAKGEVINSFSVADPSSLAIAYRVDGGSEVGELFVTGRKDGKISVFDLQGNLLRTFGGKRTSRTAEQCGGLFSVPQGVAADAAGRVYVLDTSMAIVQAFNLEGGEYIYKGYFGALGKAEGELFTAQDVIKTRNGDLIVANAGNRRLEFFTQGDIGTELCK